MRGGICTVQQALTPEATTTVKQAVGLAKRRGHAQVTPLHVASAMLAAPAASLLRKACLQCHSHPLQCKALELCFNVALNRLPASTPSPLLLHSPSHHHHHHHQPSPSFSNALVAAFKRAQAHQRRGSAETQQQPILALKIELEQLVISILDDPSVSRVMREAGFSSPHVKSRVEQSVSLDLPPTQPQPLPPPPPPPAAFEDVNSVVSVMVNKRKNCVIVGECLTTAENVARKVMETFDHSFRFVTLPLFSLKNISHEEAEQKVVELRSAVKSYMGRGGVVFYLGDLTWVSELCPGGYGYYLGIEKIIMELKRLVNSCGPENNNNNNSPRVWVMGVSTFQGYLKCKNGRPSLETLWQLHPLTIPPGTSLTLSLKFESDVEADVVSSTTKASKDIINNIVGDEQKHNNNNNQYCSCRHVDLKHNSNSATASTLPSWLRKHKDNENNNRSYHQEYSFTVGDLCKKWNTFCSQGQHKHPTFADKSLNFSSLDFNHTLPPPKEYQFWAMENTATAATSCESDDDGPANKPELLSNPNSSPNSASSSEVVMDDTDLKSFKVLDAENLRILCDEMEKDVPWQKDIVAEIATTVLQCRSGTSARRSKDQNCWLLFLGPDSKGKEEIGRSLAKLIFGTRSNNRGFVPISLSSFATGSEECSNKRTRAEFESGSDYYVQRLGEAVNENPRRVFFLEDLEEVDKVSLKALETAIETGKIKLACGETVRLKDSIVILSSESLTASSGSRASSPKRLSSSSSVSVKEKDEVSLDLNIALHSDDQHNESGLGSDGISKAVDNKFVFRVQEL